MIGTGSTALAFFLSGTVAKIFVGYDAELYELTVRAFKIFSCSFLLAGFNIFASACFTALNNGAVSALISFLRTLLFKSIPLQEIVRQLSNAFNTDIRIEDADLQNYRMTATFSDGETLEEILSLLCRNQKFEYTKTNDIITITQKLN